MILSTFECPAQVLLPTLQHALSICEKTNREWLEQTMEEHRQSDQKLMKWLPRRVQKWFGLPRTDEQIRKEIEQNLRAIGSTDLSLREVRIGNIQTFISMVELQIRLYGGETTIIVEGEWFKFLEPHLKHILERDDIGLSKTAPTPV